MNSLPLKRSLAALGVAVTLGGAAVGVASAQQATPTRPAAQGTPQAGQPAQRQQMEDQFLAAVAGKLGITVDKLKQAISDARKDLGLPQGGPGFGFGGHGPGGPGHHGPGFSFDVAASTIGITPDQLRQELAGKSLNDVAKAHNVDPAKVSAALKGDAASRIDQAVRDGKLTADQATQAKTDANTRIDQMMTQVLPQPPAGDRGPGGPRAPRGQPGTPGQPGAPRAQGTPGAQRSAFGALGPQGSSEL